jgi:hypothetical protein
MPNDHNMHLYNIIIISIIDVVSFAAMPFLVHQLCSNVGRPHGLAFYTALELYNWLPSFF